MDIDGVRERDDLRHIYSEQTYTQEQYEELERKVDLLEEENEELKETISSIKNNIEETEKYIKFKF